MKQAPTSEEIKAIVDEFFKNEPVPERTIVGMRGCITRGALDISDFTQCGFKDCGGCNMVGEALRLELNRLMKNFK